jgi:hypothetical protein
MRIGSPSELFVFSAVRLVLICHSGQVGPRCCAAVAPTQLLHVTSRQRPAETESCFDNRYNIVEAPLFESRRLRDTESNEGPGLAMEIGGLEKVVGATGFEPGLERG